MKANGFIGWINLFVAVVIVVGTTHAGQIELACFPSNPTCRDEGTSVPDCGPGGEDCGSEGSNVGMGDPNGQTCVVEADGPEGLGDPGGNQNLEENNVCDETGSGGYTVETFLDAAGNVIAYEIFQANGAELSALCFRESESSIESVTVRLAHGAMARIRKIDTSQPLVGGSVEITINGVRYPFDTIPLLSSGSTINERIKATLVGDRYNVIESGDYLLILSAPPRGAYIEEIGFATDEPNLYRSEVSLEPHNAEPYPYCFPREEISSGFRPAKL